MGYKDLKDTISDKDKFNNYKIDPLKSSIYSIAAKVFIKLPFLELGYSMKELVPLKLQADEAASELGLLSLYDMIKTSSLQDFDIDKLTKGLIKNELENI